MGLRGDAAARACHLPAGTRVPPALVLHAQRLCRSPTSRSTMDGSATIVIMSESFSRSPDAIFWRSWRRTFPLRVLGNPSTHWMASGTAMGLIRRLTSSRRSVLSVSDASVPALTATNA